MTGYELLTDEQQAEVDRLTEREQHSDTMRFTMLDAAHLGEYRLLMERLEQIHESYEPLEDNQ